MIIGRFCHQNAAAVPKSAETTISREFPVPRNYFTVRPKKFPVRRRWELSGKWLF